MSALKKGIKKIGKFVKKHWKKIVIAAAVVFTGGLATVGFSGFSGAMAAAGGGFGGFMSAVGSTMYAGLGAIGGTFGLGSGAQGAAAMAGNVQGANLFTGRLAASLGSEAAKGLINSNAAAAGQLGAPQMVNTGLAAQAAQTPGIAGSVAGPAGAPASGVPGWAVPPSGSGAGAGSGFFGGDMSRAALITTGGQTLAGLAQGYMQGDQFEEMQPKQFMGVDLTGKGQHAELTGLMEMPQIVDVNQAMQAQAPEQPLPLGGRPPPTEEEMRQLAAYGLMV